jgi:hypothetical protein
MVDTATLTKVRFIPTEDVSATLKGLMKAHSQFYWAVAWGSDNPALSDLLHYQSKIAKLVIGTHFYQTPPKFLEQFKSVKAARVIPPDGATFHPKTYLFLSSTRAVAVIGSANFTRSAMESNVEACCLIEGEAGDRLFRDIRKFITDDCWKSAKVIDDDFLRSYRIRHEATKAARAALLKFVALRRPKQSARGGDPLEMDWPNFVARLRHEKHFQNRLKVLAASRKLLDTVDSFSKLSPMERKAIAGTLGGKEIGPDSLEWGLFGSMFGFGVFKNLINSNSAEISNAMDCIPPTGVVTDGEYDMFVKSFRKAFKGQARQGAIPSASRLLAMKRPDYFVCIDTPNKKGLSSHFGLAASAVNLENYWTDLIEPITLSSWWQVPRPRGLDGRIWDGRAALLDAIFYDPT